MGKSALADMVPVDEVPETASVAESTRLHPVVDNTKDYFMVRDGERFAGLHLLIELWGARGLDDPEAIEDALCRAAVEAHATVLHSHMHRFTPNGGVSGVVVLAESHITIHTWPERDYAAVDVFMCGACDPHRAVEAIRAHFVPQDTVVSEHRRGSVR